MRLHILGICGTFMGGLAALARELGHEVEGSDANVYPPMSTQLEALGITLKEGYRAEYLQPAPDMVVVGNAMTRGNPAVEYMLDARLPYISGPQWLGEQVLAQRDVLAVAGTHGKTTTTSMLAHLLENAGMAPGFLIGGVPGNFGVSARLRAGIGNGESGMAKAGEPGRATDSPFSIPHSQPLGAGIGNRESGMAKAGGPDRATDSPFSIPHSRPLGAGIGNRESGMAKAGEPGRATDSPFPIPHSRPLGAGIGNGESGMAKAGEPGRATDSPFSIPHSRPLGAGIGNRESGMAKAGGPDRATDSPFSIPHSRPLGAGIGNRESGMAKAGEPGRATDSPFPIPHSRPLGAGIGNRESGMAKAGEPGRATDSPFSIPHSRPLGAGIGNRESGMAKAGGPDRATDSPFSIPHSRPLGAGIGNRESGMAKADGPDRATDSPFPIPHSRPLGAGIGNRESGMAKAGEPGRATDSPFPIPHSRPLGAGIGNRESGMAKAGEPGRATDSPFPIPHSRPLGAGIGNRESGMAKADGPDRATDSPFPIPHSRPFVIEADEYDTAFFDKRSKFVHYHPRIAILNNLEYDHADIFPDVAAIQRQFHHLVRTIPGNGRIIVNAEDERLAEVLAMGCWTPVESFGIDRGDWRAELLDADGSHFRVRHGEAVVGEVRWSLMGRHNVMNALAALAAAHAHGCDASALLPAFTTFENARRRMETVGEVGGIHVYDDFAHHPTAIATTLAGLRARVGKARIVVALEPRSNSMRQGAHAEALAPSLAGADRVVFLKRPELPWDAERVIDALEGHGQAVPTVDVLLEALRAGVRVGDHVVFMSNGGFENAPRRFVDLLLP